MASIKVEITSMSQPAVKFLQLPNTFLQGENIEVCYELTGRFRPKSGDWIGFFQCEYEDEDDDCCTRGTYSYIAFQWAPKHQNIGKDIPWRKVVFTSDQTKVEPCDGVFYRFLYMTTAQEKVVSCSNRFRIRLMAPEYSRSSRPAVKPAAPQQRLRETDFAPRSRPVSGPPDMPLTSEQASLESNDYNLSPIDSITTDDAEDMKESTENGRHDPVQVATSSDRTCPTFPELFDKKTAKSTEARRTDFCSGCRQTFLSVRHVDRRLTLISSQLKALQKQLQQLTSPTAHTNQASNWSSLVEELLEDFPLTLKLAASREQCLLEQFNDEQRVRLEMLRLQQLMEENLLDRLHSIDAHHLLAATPEPERRQLAAELANSKSKSVSDRQLSPCCHPETSDKTTDVGCPRNATATAAAAAAAADNGDDRFKVKLSKKSRRKQKQNQQHQQNTPQTTTGQTNNEMSHQPVNVYICPVTPCSTTSVHCGQPTSSADDDRRESSTAFDRYMRTAALVIPSARPTTADEKVGTDLAAAMSSSCTFTNSAAAAVSSSEATDNLCLCYSSVSALKTGAVNRSAVSYMLPVYCQCIPIHSQTLVFPEVKVAVCPRHGSEQTRLVSHVPITPDVVNSVETGSTGKLSRSAVINLPIQISLPSSTYVVDSQKSASVTASTGGKAVETSSKRSPPMVASLPPSHVKDVKTSLMEKSAKDASVSKLSSSNNSATTSAAGGLTSSSQFPATGQCKAASQKTVAVTASQLRAMNDAISVIERDVKAMSAAILSTDESVKPVSHSADVQTTSTIHLMSSTNQPADTLTTTVPPTYTSAAQSAKIPSPDFASVENSSNLIIIPATKPSPPAKSGKSATKNEVRKASNDATKTAKDSKVTSVSFASLDKESNGLSATAVQTSANDAVNVKTTSGIPVPSTKQDSKVKSTVASGKSSSTAGKSDGVDVSKLIIPRLEVAVQTTGMTAQAADGVKTPPAVDKTDVKTPDNSLLMSTTPTDSNAVLATGHLSDSHPSTPPATLSHLLDRPSYASMARRAGTSTDAGPRDTSAITSWAVESSASSTPSSQSAASRSADAAASAVIAYVINPFYVDSSATGATHSQAAANSRPTNQQKDVEKKGK